MYGRDDTLAFVHQQDRYAICRLHSQETSWSIRHQGVTFRRAVRPISMYRNVGMNLAKSDEAFRRGEEPIAESVLKPIEPAPS